MKKTHPALVVLGWIAVAFGVLIAVGSLFAGDGAAGKVGGVLIGVAFVFVGALLLRRIDWKAGVPAAVVALIGGGAITPSAEPAPVVSPAPASVVSTSMWRPTTSSNVPPTSSAAAASTTTTTTSTSTTTITPPPATTTTTTVGSVPGIAETDTRTPVPVPAVPPVRTTPRGSGSGSDAGGSGGSGARMCKDGTWSTAGRGACSGHGGLAR